jgi:hypothetical protein
VYPAAITVLCVGGHFISLPLRFLLSRTLLSMLLSATNRSKHAHLP